MKFDSNLFLKWITIEKSDKIEAEFRCVNLCVLTARNFQDKVVGFTAFENKSLDQMFFTRFDNRLKKPEFQNLKFTLYVPLHLKKILNSLQLPDEVKYTDIVFTSFVHIKRNLNRFVLRDKLRVVNVDDSASLLQFLKHSMEGLGFIDVVAQVSDPKLAVETIERLNPDIVTMDIQMPNMTGVDVVRKLLNRNYYRVIMISSLTLDAGSLVFEA